MLTVWEGSFVKQAVRWFAYRPDREVWWAVAVTAGGIAVVTAVLRAVAPESRGNAVAFMYSVWVGLVLAYVYRKSDLAVVGLTRQRLLPGLVVASAVTLLGVAGSLRDPSMAGATLVIPEIPRFLAMVVTTQAAAFAEQLVFAGYLQLRFEVAFGRLAGILVYAVLFTAFQVALVWLPGAVPPTGAGMTTFVIGIFVAMCLVALVFTYVRNVWALAIAAGLNPLVLNLYMLSVRPRDVLVADPKAFGGGIALILGWLFAIWLTGRMVRREVPLWRIVPLRREQ